MTDPMPTSVPGQEGSELEAAAKRLEERAEWRESYSAADEYAAEDRAVAAWLRSTAETLASDPSDYCAGAGHGDWPDGDPSCHAWFCQSVTDALNVAHSISGASDD